MFSRARQPLPFAVKMKKRDVTTEPAFAGSQAPDAELLIADVSANGDRSPTSTTLPAYANEPMVYRPADAPLGMRQVELRLTHDRPSEKHASSQGLTLHITSNPGKRIIMIGLCMILLGLPWALYVRPRLLEHRQRKTKMSARNPQSRSDSLERSPANPTETPSPTSPT